MKRSRPVGLGARNRKRPPSDGKPVAPVKSRPPKQGLKRSVPPRQISKKHIPPRQAPRKNLRNSQEPKKLPLPDGVPLAERYRPTVVYELLGNRASINRLAHWIKSREGKNAALLSGALPSPAVVQHSCRPSWSGQDHRGSCTPAVCRIQCGGSQCVRDAHWKESCETS